jgi:[ribosomal protein S18]-alanine N-acetyltransferase
MKIRAFADEDVAAVHSIQMKCLHAAQWSVDDYLRLAEDPYGMVLVAELETANPPQVVGFAAFYRLIDDVELRNLAVEPTHQRRGIARALVEQGGGKLRGTGVRRIFLEVRASNQPARELYASLGFRLLSSRKDYYQNPLKETLVLALDIAPSSQTTFQ